MRDSRISRNQCYMYMALILSHRSTCTRRAVGCILVNKRGRVLGMGYNGTPSGEPHCIDTPCEGSECESSEGLDLCRAIHAEINALCHCNNIFDIDSIYITTSPCIHCIKPLMNTSAKHIYFRKLYKPYDKIKSLWLNSNPLRTWQQI